MYDRGPDENFHKKSPEPHGIIINNATHALDNPHANAILQSQAKWPESIFNPTGRAILLKGFEHPLTRLYPGIIYNSEGVYVIHILRAPQFGMGLCKLPLLDRKPHIYNSQRLYRHPQGCNKKFGPASRTFRYATRARRIKKDSSWAFKA